MITRNAILASILAAAALGCGPADAPDDPSGEDAATPRRSAAGDSTATGPTLFSSSSVQRGLSAEDTTRSEPTTGSAREPRQSEERYAREGAAPRSDDRGETYRSESTRTRRPAYRREPRAAASSEEYDGRRRRPPGAVIRRQQHERRQRLSRQEELRRERMDRLQGAGRRLPPVAGAPGVLQADIRRSEDDARTRSRDRYVNDDRRARRPSDDESGRPDADAGFGFRTPGGFGMHGYGTPPYGGGFYPGSPGSYGGFPGGYGGFGSPYAGGGGLVGPWWSGSGAPGYGVPGYRGFESPGMHVRFWGEGFVPFDRRAGLFPCPPRRFPDHWFRWDEEDLFRWDRYRWDDYRRDRFRYRDWWGPGGGYPAGLRDGCWPR